MTFDFSKLDIPLIQCGSATPESGLCAMQMVAWFNGEEHSDSPECTCVVLAGFVRRLNDGIDDNATRRNLLIPILPHLVGTTSNEHMRKRAEILVSAAPRESVFTRRAINNLAANSLELAAEKAAASFEFAGCTEKALAALNAAIKAGPQGDFAHDPVERYEALKQLVSA